MSRIAKDRVLGGFLLVVVLCILFCLSALWAGCKRDREKADKSSRKEIRRGAVPDCKENSDFLSKKEKGTLLAMARRTVESAVRRGGAPDYEKMTQGMEITSGLKIPMGAFVTLKKGGRLRGCIGSLQPVQPLFQAVISNSVNAALRDRRFRPVGESELEELEIEVSVLSLPVEVGSHEDIEIGCHGIIFEKNGRRSTFLPHVAPEQGWDKVQTLDQLSLKAGLSRKAWETGAKFRVYTALVFSEKETGQRSDGSEK